MKKKLLLILLAMGLVFSGCNGSEDNSEELSEEGSENEASESEDKSEDKSEDGSKEKSEGQEVEAEKDEDQYLNTFYSEEPTTINSSQGADASSVKILNNVMEPLVRVIEDTDDETLNLEPAGAESWEISEDRLTYTFKIRDNKWSDGQPVKAQDYEFGIKRSVDPQDGAGGMGYLLDSIKGARPAMLGEGDPDEIGVKSLDDKTLEITLERPTPYFLQLCALRPTFPIRQDVYEEEGENYGTEYDSVVFNGPFVLTSWTHQTELQLEKNPNYWDKDNVYLEKVNWRIINEETTRMNAFLNGEIDHVDTSSAEWKERFLAVDDIFETKVKSPSVRFIFFNTQAKPFNNPKVRLAMALSIDKEETIDAIFNGVGVPAYGWVPHGITYEGKEFRDIVGEGPYKDLMEEYPDPKELLAEGLEEEGLDPDNFEFTFDLGGTDQESREIGDYYLNNFEEKLGIKMNVKLNEWSAFTDMISNGDFQVGSMTWIADFNDPYHMLSLLMTGVEGIPTQWSNEEYDQLVLDGLLAEDPDERLEKYKEAEKLACEQSPLIPLNYREISNFRRDYYKNYQDSDFSSQGLKYVYTSGRDK